MYFTLDLPGILTGSGLVAIFLITWYYRRNKPVQPQLHYVNTDLHQFILKRCDRFTSFYRPPFWIQNCHLHTILATLYPKPKITFNREYLKLDDGGALALDWVLDNVHELDESSTILIIIPGLTASHDDMGATCRLAMVRGYRVVVFNKRGHGNTELFTPKLTGFGDAADFRRCLEFLQERFPSAKIVAIGSSAGSAIIAAYLSEYRVDCILKTGVGISPGYDAIELFVKGMPKVYEVLLLKSLKQIVKRHAKVLSPVVDVAAVSKAKRFTEFDTHVYCKIYGYKDVDEYWRHHNPVGNLDKNTTVPVMCINSLDDPISQARNIPYTLFEQSPNWLLVTTDKGGHCGFLEDHDWKPWSDKLALDYIDAVLEYQTQDSQ